MRAGGGAQGTDPDVSERVFDKAAMQRTVDFVNLRFPLLKNAPVLKEHSCHYESGSGGNFIVDMTTSEPSLAIEIVEACKKKGVYAVDAPVSGSIITLQQGKLSVMVGGTKATFDKVKPILDDVGRARAHGELEGGLHAQVALGERRGPFLRVVEQVVNLAHAGIMPGGPPGR